MIAVLLTFTRVLPTSADITEGSLGNHRYYFANIFDGKAGYECFRDDAVSGSSYENHRNYMFGDQEICPTGAICQSGASEDDTSQHRISFDGPAINSVQKTSSGGLSRSQ